MRNLIITLFLLTLPIAGFSQPSNDNPAGATTLPITSTYYSNTFSGTTIAATATVLPSNPLTIYDDVWYKFEVTGATNNNVSIALKNVVFSPSVPNYLQMNLWNGALTTRYAGTANGVYNQFSLGNGTWYIQVWTDGNSSAERSSFDISVKAISGSTPINNDCAGVVTLSSFERICGSPTLGHNIGATTSTPALAIANGKNDVWYKFTALATKHSIAVSNINWAPGTGYPNIAGSSTANVNIELGQGTCGSYTTLGNSGSATTYETPTLVIGNDYYIRVSTVLTNTYTRFFDFDICITHVLPPINDNCSGAFTLPVNTDGTNTLKLSASTKGALQSSQLLTPCNGDADDDVWFKFTAPAGTNKTAIQILNSTTTIAWALYSGSCTGLTNMVCSSTEMDVLPTLTSGQTYYLRAYTHGTNSETNFEIALVQIPNTGANISCATAAILNTTYQSGTTLGLTQATTTECYTYSVPNKVMWYSFVATATSHFIEFSNVYRLSANQNGLGFRFYSGSCAALLPIKCVSSVHYANESLTGLTIGETYYVQVMENTFNGGPVMFKIRLRNTSAPSNDESSGAITLIQNTDCQTTAGTFAFSTISASSVNAIYKTDVWYSFIAATTNAKVTYNNLAADLARIVLYNAAGTAVLSDPLTDGTEASFSGLTEGTTYKIRVYTQATNPLSGNANFTICVSGTPSTSVADTPTPGSACLTVDGPVTASNSNRWLHITHAGKMVASVFDNGGSNIMGAITAKYFLNTAAVRTDPGGLKYLDRNYEITPANQPSAGTLVPIRIYFSKAEFEALVATNTGAASDVNYINDLKISRFGALGCINTLSSSAGEAIHDVTAWGNISPTVYYLQFSIPSFSSFYFKNTSTGTTLPVQCSRFNYQIKNGDIQLVWNTESEINNDHFEIQRSNDAINYSTITTIFPSSSKSYLFNDNTTRNGETYYYRIKQVDKDGKSTFICRTLKVSLGKEVNVFGNLYPNPVLNEAIIDIIKPMNGKVDIQILNLQGQTVYQKQNEITSADQQIKINISQLVKGNYILKIITSQSVYTQQLNK